MAMTALLDRLPIWGVALLTIGLVLTCIEFGFRWADRRRRRGMLEDDSSISGKVGAILGLLAFMLAFTFGMAASRYDNRKAFVLEEANDIGTAYLRADLLPEPQREPSRRLLRDYVAARLAFAQPETRAEGQARSEAIQKQLWALAAAGGQAQTDSEAVGLYIAALNQVIDLHAKRLNQSLRNRIPESIWAVLYFVIVLAMATVGYQSGLVGKQRSPASLALALAFSAVMLLIVDLDRHYEGSLTVSQRPMQDLIESMP